MKNQDVFQEDQDVSQEDQLESWIEELRLRPLNFEEAQAYFGDPEFEEFGEFNTNQYNLGYN
jgi:hypothetical protein